MAGSKEMKALQQRLAEKKAQLETLKIEIATLEDVLRLASGEPAPAPAKARSRRSNLKGFVLDLLKERGDIGINANLAVEIAQKKGEELDRGSVSSLLSRLKSEGVVEHDGAMYRLPKAFTRSQAPAPVEENDILH